MQGMGCVSRRVAACLCVLGSESTPTGRALARPTRSRLDQALHLPGVYGAPASPDKTNKSLNKQNRQIIVNVTLLLPKKQTNPQGQANKWIRNMESGRHMLVLKPATDPTYLRSLAAALPMGFPVLLEGLGERLDASLEPVLLKQTFKSVSRARGREQGCGCGCG